MATIILPHAAEFETVSRAEIFDQLVEAYDAAKALAAGDKRWASALDRAYAYALEVESFEYDIQHWAVRVPSASQPGVAFEANGVCQCRAYTHEIPCWHRALARLIRRALEPRLMAFAQEWDRDAEQARGQIVSVMVQRRRELAQIEVDELFPARAA
jgi:hypothetical protein